MTRALEIAQQIQALTAELIVLESTPEIVVTAPAIIATPAPVAPSPTLPFKDEGAFYDWLRGNVMLGPKISPSEYQGCTAILHACAADGWGIAWTADALGTAYLETAHTMLPIHEMGGTAYFFRRYDPQGQRPDIAKTLGNTSPGDGARYHGRGNVQLTGRKNYTLADKKLREMGILKPGESLIVNPDLALRPDVAAAIMVEGMTNGWFTGKRLSDYFDMHGVGTREGFKGSRRIINGQDRADDLAEYCLNFQTALQAGGWSL